MPRIGDTVCLISDLARFSLLEAPPFNGPFLFDSVYFEIPSEDDINQLTSLFGMCGAMKDST
jgi:hypothetical protein